MNAIRRKELRTACRLIGEAAQVIDAILAEELDKDALSLLEDAASELERADLHIEDAVRIGAGGKP